MRRFSLDRRRFAGHPQRGFPHPSGGSPSPSKSPPEGGNPTPRGAGACRPPVSPSGSPSTPLGHPYGVPPASPAPPPVPVRQRKGASEARRGGSPGEGLEKNQSGGADRGRQAAGSGNVGKAGQPVGRGGGSRWATPRVVHGVSLPLSTGREAPAGRAAISTSPLPGGPTRPPLGACSAPQGSRLPFRKSSEYTCLSSGPPEARF